MEKRKIKYRTMMDAENSKWFDLGDYLCKNRSEKELKKLYKSCKMHCEHFDGSRFYFCYRTWVMELFGILPANPNDYIDVKHDGSKEQIEALEKRFIDFSKNKKHLEACNYCNGLDTCYSPVVPVGEQMSKKQYRDMFTDEIKTF